MRWLFELWYRRQRATDLRFLWPACRDTALEKGQPLDSARAAFAYHAYHDRAWLMLGDAEIARRIDALE
jgi:hypothetical protein